jgi:hypothetical protein
MPVCCALVALLAPVCHRADAQNRTRELAALYLNTPEVTRRATPPQKLRLRALRDHRGRTGDFRD